MNTFYSGYLAFHSFGNKILYPWGYTNNPTSDVSDLRGFADVAKNAISNTFAQRRSLLSDLFFSDPSLSKYDVGQVSIRDDDEKEEPQKTKNPFIPNSLRRIIFGDGVDNQISQVTLTLKAYHNSKDKIELIKKSIS